MATLAGFLVRVSTIGHLSAALDFDRARVYQAAQAGVQWAGYQILKSGSNACTSAGVNVALDSTAFPGVGLTVICTKDASSTVYSVQSLACIPMNASGLACPVAAPGSNYVEQSLWTKFEQ
jgi:hypothetical protein